MGTTLFKSVNFNLAGLMEDIQLGRMALPDLQRPFVWPNKKVRDLFDSMYRGYPVGYLLLWENGAVDGVRAIGQGGKQLVPNHLVIDGQQRLTSLYAVYKGKAVLRESFQEETIEIAFRPLDGSFEVADAAIKRDPTWIPNISVFWRDDTDLFGLAGDYLERLSGEREVTAEDRKRIQQSMSRLAQLESFPFTALSLTSTIDEEQVAEVFVRINSKGTPLNQADFILTLMSVFQDAQRKELEDFCRRARVPSTAEASPFNHFIDPDPDQLLRVSVALAFRRARLQFVYSILRGKDLETGEFSEERREQQFAVLQEAQRSALDLTNWHEFLKCLLRAGFLSAKTVSSQNALLYTYALFLIGKRDYGVEPYTLRNLIARWFFFASLTGRYTSSPESRMEQDLADIRGVRSKEEYVGHLDRIMAATLTNDFWTVTLPAELATSAARSPGLFAYYAALNLLDARVLFSKLKVRELLDPTTRARKQPIERHHLFPKAYLAREGVTSRRDTNQIANYALVEWGDNIRISDQTPAKYFPDYARRFSPRELSEQLRWHGLTENWTEMSYDSFLESRRQLLAGVIRDGFETLDSAVLLELAEESAQTPEEILLEKAPDEAEQTLRDLLAEAPLAVDALREEVAVYLARLEVRSRSSEDLDLDTARRVAERCEKLLDVISDSTSDSALRLIQTAAQYFVLEDDADNDFGPRGFDDDEAVVGVVEAVLEGMK